MYIYILRLEENKYYVGRTNNLDARISDHFRGNGSYWTRKYRPLEQIDVIETDDPFDEDKYVKKMMMMFGIENVRGGSYSQIKLTDEAKNFITKEIENSQDLCFKCHQKGHMINECGKEKPKQREPDFFISDNCIIQ